MWQTRCQKDPEIPCLGMVLNTLQWVAFCFFLHGCKCMYGMEFSVLNCLHYISSYMSWIDFGEILVTDYIHVLEIIHPTVWFQLAILPSILVWFWCPRTETILKPCRSNAVRHHQCIVQGIHLRWDAKECCTDGGGKYAHRAHDFHLGRR